MAFRDSEGIRHTAYLNNGPHNEIIISSGALGSPQLLMLSGVGPEEHLLAHNITVVLDQPMVGQGMSDNPMNSIFIPSPNPLEVSLIEVVGITSFGSYIEAAGGENFAGGNPRDYGMFSPKVRILAGLLLNRPIKIMFLFDTLIYLYYIFSLYSNFYTKSFTLTFMIGIWQLYHIMIIIGCPRVGLNGLVLTQPNPTKKHRVLKN